MATACSGDSMASFQPGMVLTLASPASFLEAILSPIVLSPIAAML